MRKNFIIVGTQRTGSTALFRSFNFHPEIACGREWTHDFPFYKKLTVTKRALEGDFTVLTARSRDLINKLYNDETRWLGFKLLFRSSDKWLIHPRFAPALWVDRLEDYVQWLSHRPDIHVIHIIRRNQIDWLKSKYVASKTDSYTQTPYPDGLKIEIPLRGAVKRVQTKKWLDSRLATLEYTNPYLPVYYEEFLHSNHDVVLSLMRFLQCDPDRLRDFDYRKLKKQSKGSAEKYISNYDQLVRELRNRNLCECN
jgi:hypothetical protein